MSEGKSAPFAVTVVEAGRERPNNETSISVLHLYDLIYERIEGLLAATPVHPDLLRTLQQLIAYDREKKRSHQALAVLPPLTCWLVGGTPEKAVPLAVTWNLLHLAADILDKVEDGQPAAGPRDSLPPDVAVNAATAFIFLAQMALDTLADKEVSHSLIFRLRSELYQVALQMCAGQHLELMEPMSLHGDLDTYWYIAGAKSGHCFAWACRAGALLGEGTPLQVDRCGTYGYNLGVLVQIVDDFVDLWPAAGPGDLALGRKTLPVLYALAVAPPNRRERLLRLLDQARRSPEAEAEAREEVIRLGGLHYLLVEAQIRRKRAQQALQAFPAGPPRDDLLTLLDGVLPVLQWREHGVTHAPHT